MATSAGRSGSDPFGLRSPIPRLHAADFDVA